MFALTGSFDGARIRGYDSRYRVRFDYNQV